MSFYDQSRAVLRYRLWEAIPRKNRLVAHRENARYTRTRCGLPLAHMTFVHHTVASAIGADECKACAR